MSTNRTAEPSARRVSLLGDSEGAFAVARHVRVTPQKARRIANIVRGAGVEDALATLKFAPQDAANDVRKVVESAIANAVTNENLKREDLVLSQVFIDEGATLKRFRPRAQGRASQILKRTSHITVVVTPREQKGSAR